MPTVVETQVLDVKANPAEVDQLVKSLEKQEDAYQRLVKAGPMVVGSQAAFDAAIAKSRDEIVRLKAEIDKLPASTQAMTNDAQRRFSGMNNALRSAGYGISDIFSNNGPIGSKLIGFSNNISGITTGILQTMGKLGPGAIVAAAGLEIAFTAAASAMNALGVKTLDDLVTLISGGVLKAETGLKGLEERVKSLTDKPHLVAVEVLELDQKVKQVAKLKADLQAIEEMQKSQTHAESESGKAVKEALSEATDASGKVVGAQGVLAELKRQLVNELTARDPTIAEANRKAAEADAEAEAAEGKVDPETGIVDTLTPKLIRDRAQRERDRAADARQEITKAGGAADLAAGGIIDTAQKGSGAAQEQAQKQLAARLGKAGLGAAAAQVGASSPADMKAYEEQAELEKDIHAVRKNLAAEEKEAAKEEKEAAKEQQAAHDAAEKATQFEVEHDKKLADFLARKAATDKTKADRGEKRDRTEERKAGADVAKRLSGLINVDEQAAALVGQVRGMGGVPDGQGGVQRMNAAQQQEYIRREVFRFLVQNKLAPAQQAQEAAGPITAKAFGVSDDAMIAARAPQPRRVGPRRPNRGDLAASGFPSVPATDPAQAVAPLMRTMDGDQRTTSTLIGGMGQLAGKHDLLARQQAMNRQDTQRVMRRIAQAGETAQNMGGPGG